jgi:hypothetical protein
VQNLIKKTGEKQKIALKNEGVTISLFLSMKRELEILKKIKN